MPAVRTAAQTLPGSLSILQGMAGRYRVRPFNHPGTALSSPGDPVVKARFEVWAA